MSQSIAAAIEAYLTDSFNARQLKVGELTEFTGGAARSTYGLDVAWSDSDGKDHRDELVLRIDPQDEDGSLVPSNMRGEYEWYSLFSAAGDVPVPEPILLEMSDGPLGAPFMVMRRLHGFTDFDTIFESDFASVRHRIGLDAFTVLGRIASRDITTIGSAGSSLPPRSEVWEQQLNYWDGLLSTHALGPMPVTKAAIRQLRRNPPRPPDRLVISHGDFRLGNFLYDRNGVVGLLDWELGHVSDPHEDLGWASLQNWRRNDPDKVWGFIDAESAYSAWSDASGIRLDHESLRWWTVLNHIKATALWVKGAHAATTGKTDRAQYLTANMFLTPTQEEYMVNAMEGGHA